MSSQAFCPDCSAFEVALTIGAVPAHLRLERKGFARDPQSGSRLDRYTCGTCGTNWLVEMGTSEEVVDWYQVD